MFGIDTLNILVQKWLNKGIGIKKKIDNIEGCKNCSLTKRSPSRVLSKRCRFSICSSSNGGGNRKPPCHRYSNETRFRLLASTRSWTLSLSLSSSEMIRNQVKISFKWKVTFVMLAFCICNDFAFLQKSAYTLFFVFVVLRIHNIIRMMLHLYGLHGF